MKIEIVPVLGDNYAYLLICPRTGQAAAVDPADADAVSARAAQLGASLTAVLCTHHHFDHTGGNASLLQLHPGLEVYGHAADRGRIPAQTRELEHGARLEVGTLELRVLHTPGHTRGAVCYLVQDALFTGDTLFGGGCGRLFEGDPPTMFNSLRRIIAPLPPPTRLYFGHEYTATNLGFAATVEPDNRALERRLQAATGRTVPATLELELETNPFLRPESEEIRRTLAARFPGDDLTPLQVFTRLREMRNNW